MKSTALRNSKHVTPEALLQLISDTQRVLFSECKTTSKEVHAIMASSSLISSAGQSNGTTQSSLWLPIDLFLEDAINGSQVAAYSSIEILTGKHLLFYCNVQSFAFTWKWMRLHFCVLLKRVDVAGLVKALQAVNGTSWLDTFLGLWIAALRLVQRVGIDTNLILLLEFLKLL